MLRLWSGLGLRSWLGTGWGQAKVCVMVVVRVSVRVMVRVVVKVGYG